MKSLKILLVLWIMLGFAVSANSLGKGNKVERPIKCSTYNVVKAELGDIEILSISGHVSHLGKVTGTMPFYRPPWHIPPYILGAEMVAANGDSFFFNIIPVKMKPDYQGSTTGTLTGAIEISGGTGRFEDCSGWINITGTYDTEANYCIVTGEGKITY